MLRVLILSYEYPPLGGGSANAIFHLIRELSTEPNLSIDLITSSPNKKNSLTKLYQNINVYKLNVGKQGNLHHQSRTNIFLYTIKAYLLAKKLCRQKKYDVVDGWFSVPGGFIAWLLKKPYIVSLRGSDVPGFDPRFAWLDKFVLRRLSKKIWKQSKIVIGNSKALIELAKKTLPNHNYQIIPNGVDLNMYHPTQKNQNEKFVVLSTSRLVERKGLQYLIEGFGIFSKKNSKAKLILVGEGPLYKKLKLQVDTLKISDKVEFTGLIATDQMDKYYQQANVFVLPSLNEGMSNCVLEAMACGLPIITTNIGGTHELVDETNGIIIPTKNALAIARVLGELNLDKQLSQNMAQTSRAKAGKMGWSKMAQSFIGLYKEAKELTNA